MAGLSIKFASGRPTTLSDQQIRRAASLAREIAAERTWRRLLTDQLSGALFYYWA